MKYKKTELQIKIIKVHLENYSKCKNSLNKKVRKNLKN